MAGTFAVNGPYAVGLLGHVGAGFVEVRMTLTGAQRSQVFDVGEPAVVPLDDVIGIGSMPRCWTSRFRAHPAIA